MFTGCIWRSRRVIGLALVLAAAASVGTIANAEDGKLEFSAGLDFLRDIPLRRNGEIIAVVEAPAGSRDLWRLEPKTGKIVWKNSRGVPARISFAIGYPANFGFFPATVAPKPYGDGKDPLRVLIVGDPLPTGSIVPVRPIGLMRLKAANLISAFVIAAPASMIPFEGTMDQLTPGASAVISRWLENYRGPGAVRVTIENDLATAHQAIHHSRVEFKRTP